MAAPLVTASQCFVPKTKEEEEQVKKACKQYRELVIPTLPRKNGWTGDYSYLYQGCWISSIYVEGVMYLQEHFKARPTDVFLATHPKCGTTWLKGLIFSIMNRATYTSMEQHPLLTVGVHECVPFLDVHLSENIPFADPEILPSPRLLSTHVPYALLPNSVKGPDGCRIINVWRDPKDAFVSLWHMMHIEWKTVQREALSIEEAFDLFSQGISFFGPIWDHVLGYWKASLENPNKILFLKYEDMKTDPISHVKKLAEFLGQPFTAEEEQSGTVHEIIKLCSFEIMSSAKVPNTGSFHDAHPYESFFRKGKTGESKIYLTPEMIQRLDQITEEKFKGTSLAT